MKIAEKLGIAALAVLLTLNSSRGPALAQQAPSTIESINLEYERELLKLEKLRVDHLGRLAVSQPKDQALATYDLCFRLAIAKNLYAQADPFAVKVIRSEDPSTGVAWLAHLIHIVEQADRGAFEDSLRDLTSAIGVKGPTQAKTAAKAAGLSVATQASIVDAYYQRLIHADQIEVAQKAMTLVAENAEAPAVRDLATRRVKQLALVGKPSPPINGLDLDGKPFLLADTKGEVVLVVFWATWCLPNAQEIPWLDYIRRTYQGKGLRIVGINLDSAQDSGMDLKTMLPQVRRFLLEYNITWPTLLNGPGELDYAKLFGVTELPGSVLIGRDGKVSHLDLGGKKLEKAIAEALAKKP